jgi:hypothetical protein
MSMMCFIIYSIINASHDRQMDPPAAGSFVAVDAVVGLF